MAEETITLKFDDADSRPQREWKRQLDDLCRRLVSQGEVARARAHVVFPGDPDPEMASMFTVDLVPLAASGVSAALQRMRSLPGVQYAQRAAPRRAVGANRTFGNSIPGAA
jgi:hypothetical protein